MEFCRVQTCKGRVLNNPKALEQVHQSFLHIFYPSEPRSVLLRGQAVQTRLLLGSFCVHQLQLCTGLVEVRHGKSQ